MTLNEIAAEILAAKKNDKFPHRGALAVSCKKGKFRVERIRKHASGKCDVFPCSEFLPAGFLLVHVLQAEAQFGVGNV